MDDTVFNVLIDDGKRFWRNLASECYLSYRFVWRDLSATVIPNLILTVAALKSKEAWTFAEALAALGRSFLYFWLYIYGFCLANQISGIDEDRANKPDRPLSAGLVSYRGALRRWAVVMLLFSLVGWWFGILKWAVLWQACIVLHNFCNWSKHWFTKNFIIMQIGVVALMAPAWELVTPLNPTIWRWIIIMAIMIGITINLQDLRDIQGDRLMGRKTLPICWGEARTRIALCVSFILLAVVIHFGLMMPAGHTWPIVLCDLLLAAIDVVIAVRIITVKTPRADHKTYMLYTYWHCCVMASAILVL